MVKTGFRGVKQRVRVRSDLWFARGRGRDTSCGARMALEALGDDATDEQKRDAKRMVEAVANALRDTLRMNGGSNADIEAAIRDAETARVAAEELQATITAAANAEAAVRMAAVNAAEHLTEAEEDGHTETIALLQVTVTQAQARVEAKRMAEAEEERKANEAMAATAAKLYAGIAAASGDETTATEAARAARIIASATGAAPIIEVNYGGDLVTVGAANTVELTVDKDTTVADNHGWKGKRYVEEDDDGTITEAVVYSDEMPMQGPKINSGTGDDNVGFELDATTGALELTADAAINNASRIASPRFTHTAGTETFELPADDPGGPTMLTFPGSYYGVAGTYTCTPADGSPCSVIRGANGGYTFGAPTVWMDVQALQPGRQGHGECGHALCRLRLVAPQTRG